MKILLKNIKELLQVREEDRAFLSGLEMGNLPSIRDAYLFLEEGKIAAFGPMINCPNGEFDEIHDLRARMVLPAWCDSHSHLVYAGNREGEFIDRIKGLTYEEIARRGGGILNSAKTLQHTSEDDLYQQSKIRLEEVMQLGTGALEIKSGYGLTVDAELKMLRVIQRLKQEYPIPVKATFLPTHALPQEYKNDKTAFLHQMLEKALPQVAEQGLAEYIDVFCEKGYFDLEDTQQVLAAGQKYALIPKIHVNQFNTFGGVALATRYQARSVDHLEELREEDIEALKGSRTMPVALPGCSFFLGIPYTPARRIIDAGLPLALASDYNPGSAPSGNMNFVLSAACIKMNLSPEEAINAATLNGAYAMGLEKEVGSITIGKRANLLITNKINSYGVLPYAFGSSLIEQVLVNGLPVESI